MLEVKNLQKNFGSFVAIDDLNFSIEKGSCVALLGPNGAGKTTTLHMLAGISTPTKGTITLDGSNGRDRREHIGFLSQYPTFYGWMTPIELLRFVGQLSGMKAALLSERITYILTLVGLEEVAKKKISGFSGGMKQRLGIAQALLHEPDLLLLDEPVSSLDPVGRREIMNLLHELKKETTIFFSTHVLHDAEEICDDILIMKKGVIKISGSLQQLKKNVDAVVFKIKTAEATEEWLSPLEKTSDSFQETPFIVHLTVAHEHASVVQDVILQAILAKKITLERWDVVESSLEDLFLKVVRQ